MSIKKGWLSSAHRGFVEGDLKENSLAAYYNAFLNGADMIETDARLTSDGVLIVNHDDTVKGFLKEKTNDQDLINTACALSQGSIGRAIEIVENESLKKAADTAIDIVKSAVRGDRYETLKLLSAAALSSELFDILDFMVAILENAITKKNDVISKQITCSGKRTMKMLKAVINAKRSTTFNVNKSLLMTHLCVKMYE